MRCFQSGEWLTNLACLGFMAYQPFAGYLILNPFLYK